MKAQSWAELILANMQFLGEDFRPNELAYLALTSKIELPIRDRLAFRLCQRLLESGDLAVAREWKNHDLAVVTNGSEARLLLEAKAMYSFDLFTSSGSKFVRACSDDRRKLLGASASSPTPPTLLTLALVTHPHRADAIPPHWCGVVKYFAGIRRFSGRSLSDVKQEILRQFRPPDFPPFALGKIDGGVAFGTEVSVVYALFGPHNGAHSV